MESNTLDNFICPICGTKLLWMPVSHIFVCEGCRETFSEDAKFYLHNYDEYIASKKSHGNAAAMREALVFLRDQELWMLEGNVRHCVGLTVFGLDQTCKIMRGVIEDALSAPPRQCDVGTPEEQGERCLAEFDQWRRKGDGKKLITAIMNWAQMPYKAQEGDAK